MFPSHERFTVSKIDIEADWNELMSVHWRSWTNPLQASGELTFPFLGSNTPEEAVAYEVISAELLADAKQNAETIFWIKVVDNLKGKIVGGVCLKHERKRPTSSSNFTGCGFEPGSERQELADSFYQQLLAWRVRLAKGQHMCK
jgi:hypothetical protein